MANQQESLQNIRALALADLYFFCKGVVGFTDFQPHVHGKSCAFLQHYPGTRKGLVEPRGFFKTSQIVGDSIWRVLPERFPNDPWHSSNNRILIVQNIDTNAAMRVHMIKEIFQSNQLFQAVFPEIIPENFNKTRWSDYIADIPRAEKHPEGTFNAAGVGTALTSRHFTIVNEDDTIAPKKDDLTGDEARPTKEDIQKAIGFHRTVPNLLVDHKTNLVRFIGTRWCQGDPIGWIRENQKNYAWFEMSVWDKTRLPERIPIYPERFDLEVLTALKEEQGSYIFASQYENDPLDESKLKFKEEWLSHFYDRIPEDGLVFMSVDPAISERRKADSIVILAAKLCPNKDVVVLEYIKRKATNRDPAQTVEEVLAMNAKWQPVTIWVETIAYQKALKNLIDQEALKQRVACPTEGFADYSEDSKNVMISALQPIAERGNLWMRSYHTELQQELKDFPYAAHDDVANALAIIVKQGYYPMASAKSAGSEVDLDYTVEKLLKEIRSRNASHGMLAPLHVEFSRQMVQEYLGRR